MKNLMLYSRNLDNSLVFYRSLFNRMPIAIAPSHICFKTDQFNLKIMEGEKNHICAQNYLEVKDRLELIEIHRRMTRFKTIERMMENCENIHQAIGLTDPDGNKWVVGDPEVDVHFEKCYINTETINL